MSGGDVLPPSLSSVASRSTSSSPRLSHAHGDNDRLNELVIHPSMSGRRGSADTTASTASSSTGRKGGANGNKLAKWLPSTKGRPKSFNSSRDASHSPPPDISLSPSSSSGSNLSLHASTSTLERPSIDSRRRGSNSSSLSALNTSSGTYRASQLQPEVLEEWADASLSPAATPTGEHAQPVDKEGSVFRMGSGKGFTLRRKHSSLRLFGGLGSASSGGGADENASPRLSSSSTSALPTYAAQDARGASREALGTSLSSGTTTNRLGGWLSSVLRPPQSPVSPTPPPIPSSSTAPSLPSTATPPSSANSSPVKRLGPLDRIIDRAAQYFLDHDSAPDYDTAEIWLLGVRHDGHVSSFDSPQHHPEGTLKRSSVPKDAPPGTGWPPSFYQDFYSRVGLTYRTHFPPIPCSSSSSGGGGLLNTLSMSIGRSSRGLSNGASANGEDGLSSDTGWGCMLRTGQSLLANALVNIRLGRDWRRSTHAPPSSFPAYAHLLSLFLDSPSPSAPFSVHHFAHQGSLLGKNPGEWFGPSTAAGAIKALAGGYSQAGLAVVEGRDGTIYKSDVGFAAKAEDQEGAWSKPVLVLLQLRLGIDRVNPIYFEAVKGLFQFPQSVGIAGGRPSSSYYFVGSQSSSLFYIDPHHPRPTVPFVPPPPNVNLRWYESAYSDTDLKSYHSEKVRKMPLTSLDPSMLLGFLIRDEADWQDFASRVKQLGQVHKPIFAVADSPPSWMLPHHSSKASTSSTATDSDRGVESLSETEDEWLSPAPSDAAGEDSEAAVSDRRVSKEAFAVHEEAEDWAAVSTPKAKKGWDDDGTDDEEDGDESAYDQALEVQTPVRLRTDHHPRPTAPPPPPSSSKDQLGDSVASSSTAKPPLREEAEADVVVPIYGAEKRRDDVDLIIVHPPTPVGNTSASTSVANTSPSPRSAPSSSPPSTDLQADAGLENEVVVIPPPSEVISPPSESHEGRRETDTSGVPLPFSEDPDRTRFASLRREESEWDVLRM